MGIKDLWSVLTPYFERKPLYELQHKTVAVDLSCWVCEAQNVAEYQVQPRMYLRNLYFRTCYLLLLDVKLVFVLEGKAPELKYRTISDRNKHQFKGAKPKTSATQTGKGRTRFNHTLKQCEDMLRLMGLACITGKGEAEATCAYLNSEGLIDGCISQDSDCFAYGAKVVYINFSISQQGPFASSGGAVDIYNIQKSIDAADFGRNKIIAMALLCGSDYTEGVHGIGKDSALKFFERFSDREVLQRIFSWRTDTSHFEEMEKRINDKSYCTACGHHGKIQSHTKNGCLKCSTTVGCNDLYKEERLANKNELNMRSKALTDPDFPDKLLIKEFMEQKDQISRLELEWKQPNLLQFIIFTVKFLDWEELYAFEKIFPILTRWQVINYKKIEQEYIRNIFYPDFIKKNRNPKGIPSYEIIWKDDNNYFKNIIPEEQLENVDVVKLYSTVEPQELVKLAHKELVEKYEQSKIKPKKASKRKIKEKNVDEISNMLANTSISEPKQKTKRIYKKRAPKSKAVSNLENNFEAVALNQPKITSYLKTAIENDAKNNCSEIKTISLAPCSSIENLDMSCFGDEDDMANLSGIIDNITKSMPEYLHDKVINYNVFTKQDHKKCDLETNFFANSIRENDLFEKSMATPDSTTSDTEDDDVLDRNVDESSDDSFVITDIPLAERLALKVAL